MNEEKQALCDDLALVDADLVFLFMIVTGVLLSWLATVRQRDALCLTIQGQTEQAEQIGDVTRLRLGTSALVAGSLGFFFMQALDAWKNAGADDPTAKKSAWFNLIASFLVLLAALIRLLDLNFVRRAQPALAGDLLPD